MLKPLFHATVVAINVFTLWFDQEYVNIPSAIKEKTDRMPFKGRLMFLTIWSLILQTVYFTISLLNDLLGSDEPAPRRSPLIRKFKDLVFSLAFPVGIYVSFSFWGIYFYDKELIFPEHIEKAFPVWMNHTMHTTITVFLLLEMLLTNRTYPSKKVGLAIVTIFNLSYIVWIHVLFNTVGAWPYPILHVLNTPMRIAFLNVATIVGYTFYFLGEALNSVLAKPQKKQKNEPKKKRK